MADTKPLPLISPLHAIKFIPSGLQSMSEGGEKSGAQKRANSKGDSLVSLIQGEEFTYNASEARLFWRAGVTAYDEETQRLTGIEAQSTRGMSRLDFDLAMDGTPIKVQESIISSR